MFDDVRVRGVARGLPVEIERFRRDVIDERYGSESAHFQFNAVIPEPEVLARTGTRRQGLLIERILRRDWTLLREPQFSGRGFDGVDELIEWVERFQPDFACLIRHTEKALAQTGFSSWEQWREAHWGTTSEAFQCSVQSYSPDCLIFRFTTEHRFPEGVIDALHQRYSELEFHVAGRQEFFEHGHAECNVFGSSPESYSLPRVRASLS